MLRSTASGSFVKKSVMALLSIPVALSISICPVSAEKLTTYLAPQYENIPFKPEAAFISLGLIPDAAGPNGLSAVSVTNECELLEVTNASGYKVGTFPGACEYAKDVIPALAGSQEMLDSVKLRMIARKIKYDLIVRSGNASYAEFYKNYITAPVALFIGFNAGMGPACAIAALYLPLANGGYYFFNTVTYVEDINKFFSIADAIKNDTFDLVIAHENAHGIMFDMYGSRMKDVDSSKKSNIGHDGPYISDRNLAYIEGWAEAFEALYGPANPLLKLKEEDRKKYRISEFLFTRQDPVRRDSYIWQTKDKKGLLKNGNQLISTEGAIAGQFYDILTSKSLKEPFVKSVSVMFNHRPKDYVEFLKGWVKDHPEDKQTVYRIFLENTNYATASNEARSLYHDYYQAKIKFVQKKMDEKAFYVIKNKWLAFKEGLFKDIMQNDAIDANVGPDLWMNLASGASPDVKDLHLNLSLVTKGALMLFKGMTPEDADVILKARESMGVLPYKTATEGLSEILGAEKANKIIADNGITNL